MNYSIGIGFLIKIAITQKLLSYSHFSKNEEHRIVGGHNTTIEKHPYMLSLQYFGHHICGASVLSEKWALTASHCFAAKDPLMSFLTVRAATSFHKLEGIQHAIKSIIRHENYSRYNTDNDIALLELEGTFTFDELIQPIKIPKENEFLMPGSLAVVIGWGGTDNDNYLHEKLREAYLFTISQEDCFKLWKDRITTSMICAHSSPGGKDSCQNDSGGPLVVGNKQVGIVSWGSHPCGNSRQPGVYTKVSHFSEWIARHIGVTNSGQRLEVRPHVSELKSATF